MIKRTFQESWVKEVCSHMYKYDRMNFHGRIGDLLIIPSTISTVLQLLIMTVENQNTKFGNVKC
jgi:hypothetical protein